MASAAAWQSTLDGRFLEVAGRQPRRRGKMAHHRVDLVPPGPSSGADAILAIGARLGLRVLYSFEAVLGSFRLTLRGD
jgi:hypothetical protein